MSITNHMRVKNAINSLYGAEFASSSITPLTGLTVPQVKKVLTDMTRAGHIEAVDEVKTNGGGRATLTYKAVKKESEFKFQLPELRGVWRELTMTPHPIDSSVKVRVFKGA